MRFGPWVLVSLAAWCLAGPASAASAQVLGAGPRMAYVRPDASEAGPPSMGFAGALLRARLSRRTSLELSIDYRRFTDDEGRRVRRMPLQGSLLLYPFRGVLSTYLVGGFGRYAERIEAPADDGETPAVSTTTTGYHAGLGGELRLGRRAAFHIDYRYTLIHAGSDAGHVAGAIPIPGTISLQEKLRLSHEGSMWTTGVTVYF